uniref:STN domain-containing protein n=1 Tax=Azotobacter vinelandii TaxID=354 RepID=UPI0018D2944A
MPSQAELSPLAKALLMRNFFRPRAAATLIVAITLPVSVQTQAQEVIFNVPAQPLSSALQAFGTQSNMQLLYSYEMLRGLHSNEIKGQLPPLSALEELLKGTGIGYTLQGNVITLFRNEESGTMTLNAMAVEDNALGTITENTKSYTPGTIATATRLVLT